MSKLNSYNLDVQRMLNVLKETFSKIIICSLFSFEGLEDNIEKIKPLIKNQELLNDIKEHQDKIIAFHDKHIIKPEDQNANDKAIDEEEEMLDEEGQPKDKENVKKEVNDLTELDKTAPEVIDLAKSIRNFCRKYYRDKEFIKIVYDLKKTDVRIENFLTNFEKQFNAHYEKIVKMTLEEEMSESSLNISLKTKIEDLKDQIQSKTERLNKLKKEHEDYKTKCSNDISEIKNQISNKREDTKKKLDDYTDEINEKLNRQKEENENNLKSLRDELEKAKQELTNQTDFEGKEENAARINYTKAKTTYEAQVKEYDNKMSASKHAAQELSKEIEKCEIELNDKTIEFDAVENKYNFLKENFLLTQQKCKDAAYAEAVKQKAVEWMQGQFRGFMTRKQLRKKYKFLNVLRAPKKIDPEEADKKKKGNKKK